LKYTYSVEDNRVGILPVTVTPSRSIGVEAFSVADIQYVDMEEPYTAMK
jgi:hypothetical protein